MPDYIQAQIDTNQVRAFMKLLLDSNLSAAWVQAPDFTGKPIHLLRNGQYAELDEQYNQYAIRGVITKLNIRMPLKGEFDSMIFVQPELDPHQPNAILQFNPYPAEEYVVFLKSCFNPSGQPDSWTKEMPSSIFSPLTAFDIAEFYQGVLILKENPAAPLKSAAIFVNPSEMKSIRAIFDWVNDSKRTFDLSYLQTLAAGPFTHILVNLLTIKFKKP